MRNINIHATANATVSTARIHGAGVSADVLRMVFPVRSLYRPLRRISRFLKMQWHVHKPAATGFAESRDQSCRRGLSGCWSPRRRALSTARG